MPPKTKKTLPWTEAHKKNFTWLFNTYIKTHPDANRETFIEENKRSLMTFIETYDAWGDGSKEAQLFMVARYLHNKNPSDKYSTRYSNKGHEYMMKNRNKEDDNQLDDKEVLSYRSHEFFEALIDDIDKSTLTTKEEHMKYLLLNMLVYQPPLRTSFYSTAKIIRTKKENDKITNFVSINRRGSLKVSYIVNKDKASNYKVFKMNKNLSSIVVEDKKLAELINESYNKYPRDYLFVGITGDNVSDGTLLKWLKSITGIEGLNFDIMRSSYITWFYQNNKTFGEKTKLAKQMRHSAETAARNYNKVFDTSPEVIQNQNTELLLKLKALEQQLQECQIKNKSVEEDSKLFKKRRSDIIYRINKGTKPKESTLKIYKITQDEETKVYK
jgi:hypothetical protein